MTDEVIRGRLLALTSDLPGGPVVLPADLVAVAHRRMRRRRGALGALVSVLVVAAAGLGLASTGAGRPVRSLNPVTAPSDPLPAAWQSVGFYGVSIHVPADWKIDATRCGTPMQNTVVRDNGQATALCSVGQPPGLTVVHLTHPGLYFGAAYARLARTPAIVGGMRALTGIGQPLNGAFRGPFVQVVVLLDQAVVVAVEGPDAGLSHRLLQTLQPGDVDAAGCQRRILGLTPVGDVGLGARTTFMPAGYEHLTACRYQDNALVFSTQLPVSQAQILIHALDAAPRGRAGPDRIACSPAQTKTSGWILRGSYRDGPTREVFINDHPCGKRFLSNGGRIAQLTASVATALFTGT